MLPSGHMRQSLLGYAAGTHCACLSMTGVLCWSGTATATPTAEITACKHDPVLPLLLPLLEQH